jgi:hypothetical protein
MPDDKCLECGKSMISEGFIGDDILLCHACYDNLTLKKWGYLIQIGSDYV